jgi:hypothetical protein
MALVKVDKQYVFDDALPHLEHHDVSWWSCHERP